MRLEQLAWQVSQDAPNPVVITKGLPIAVIVTYISLLAEAVLRIKAPRIRISRQELLPEIIVISLQAVTAVPAAKQQRITAHPIIMEQRLIRQDQEARRNTVHTIPMMMVMTMFIWMAITMMTAMNGMMIMQMA